MNEAHDWLDTPKKDTKREILRGLRLNVEWGEIPEEIEKAIQEPQGHVGPDKTEAVEDEVAKDHIDPNEGKVW